MFVLPKFRDYHQATLNYDAQTANFNLYAKLTGGTSSAVGYILADDDQGTTGTLTLEGVGSTDFTDGETIADDGSTPGSADADGTLNYIEYVWEKLTLHPATAPTDEYDRFYTDFLTLDTQRQVATLEAEGARRYWQAIWEVGYNEMINLRTWANKRVFWLYPNQYSATRYAVRWDTPDFVPEPLPGNEFRVETTLIQVEAA